MHACVHPRSVLSNSSGPPKMPTRAFSATAAGFDRSAHPSSGREEQPRRASSQAARESGSSLLAALETAGSTSLDFRGGLVFQTGPRSLHIAPCHRRR